MDIPLTLDTRKPNRLVYALPLWFRITMAAMAAILIAALAVAGGAPGLIGWGALALAAFAALYEERWTLDLEHASLRHRFGLLFAARRIEVPFTRISAFTLRSFARGAMPGGEEDRALREAALSAAETGDANGDAKTRRKLNRVYVALVCLDAEGNDLVLNILPARRVEELKTVGRRLAEAAGKPFLDEARA